MMFGLMSAVGLLTAASGTVVRIATDEAALEDYTDEAALEDSTDEAGLEDSTEEAGLEDYTEEEVSCMNKTVSYYVGELSAGSNTWETCSVGQPKVWAPTAWTGLDGAGGRYTSKVAAADTPAAWEAFCDSKVVYSQKFKRFVKCQYKEMMGGITARRTRARRGNDPSYKPPETKAINGCITGPADKYAAGSVKVCALEKGSDVHGAVAGQALGARKECTAALCEMARTGSWMGWSSAAKKKGQTAAWPRHVDGFNSWGWRHSARMRCETTYAGYTIIDVEKLYEDFDDRGDSKGHLVKDKSSTNPIFDKTKCGCSTDSTCP